MVGADSSSVTQEANPSVQGYASQQQQQQLAAAAAAANSASSSLGEVFPATAVTLAALQQQPQQRHSQHQGAAPPVQSPGAGVGGGGGLPPGASHSLQHLNKLASEQQQTLAGTLGHGLNYPPSPVVIKPNGVDTGSGMNGPLTPQSTPGGVTGSGGPAPQQPGNSGATPTTPQQQQQNGQDVQNNNTVKVKSCAGCGARIIDRFLLYAMDRYWHTGCLKCSCCQAQLGEIGTTCYAKAGMILCKNDYIRCVQFTFSFNALK